MIKELNRVGYAETVKSYTAGHLDFDHVARLQFNFEETERRERFCRVKLAPYIRENYTKFPILLTHNHPLPLVVNELARQVAQELSLQFVPIPPKDFQNYACITLEAG